MKFDIFLITDFSNDYILNRPTKPYDVYSKNQPRNRKPCNDGGFECISYFRLVNVFLYYHLSLKKTLLPFSSKMSLLNGLAEIKTCHEDMPRKLKKISVWGFFFILVIVEVGQLNRSKYRWSCILNGSYFLGSRK